MPSRVWRVLQWILGFLIVAFVFRYVARNWAEVRSAQLEWHLSLPHGLAAMAVVWAVFALLADAWRRMVGGWGYPLGWWQGARIWLLSSMAKYVPGKVWALAGMAVMAERRGIPAWCAAGSAVVLQLLSIGSGALVVAVTGLAVGGVLPGQGALAGIALGIALAAFVMLWPPVTGRVLRAVAPSAELGRTPGPAPVVYGLAANLAAWVGYGWAFWLLARATLPGASLGLTEAIAAYTASYIAGVLAPFAPGGLGVRESVLIIALQGHLGLGTALALAAVARLGMTLAEVLATVPFLIRTPDAARD